MLFFFSFSFACVSSKHICCGHHLKFHQGLKRIQPAAACHRAHSRSHAKILSVMGGMADICKAPRIYRLLSPKYRKPNTDTSHLNTDPAPPKYRQLPIPSGHHRGEIPGLRPWFSLGPGLGRSRAPMAGHNPTSGNSSSARLLLRQVYLLQCVSAWGMSTSICGIVCYIGAAMTALCSQHVQTSDPHQKSC